MGGEEVLWGVGDVQGEEVDAEVVDRDDGFRDEVVVS